MILKVCTCCKLEKPIDGFHCKANLQILTKTQNIQKGNRAPEDVASAHQGQADESRRYRHSDEGHRSGG